MFERFRLSLFPKFVCISTLLLGCSTKNASDPQCYPVTGRVTFKGKPAKFAVVSFVPADSVDDRMPAGAIVDEQGEFRLLTQKRIDGAEPGEYIVSVSWQIPKHPGSDDPEYGPELLPKKFWDPKTSGLKATIEPADNELPAFDLNP